MELSTSMIFAIKNGEREPSDKVLFRLRALEEKLGLIVEACVTSVPTTGKPVRACAIISWASAGESHAFEDQGKDTASIATDCKDANCYALTIEGDSMSPSYLNGDVVVVAPSQEAQHGDLVIAKTMQDDVYFKRLEFSRDLQTIRLVSFNPNYPALEFTRPELRFIHPVFSITRYPQKRLNH